MINVTIQNPAKPEQVHQIPMKDLNNAMCALLSLKEHFKAQGLMRSKFPLLWIDTQEIGTITHVMAKRWAICMSLSDGRRVLKDSGGLTEAGLTSAPVLAQALGEETTASFPAWIYTWAAEVGL